MFYNNFVKILFLLINTNYNFRLSIYPNVFKYIIQTICSYFKINNCHVVK